MPGKLLRADRQISNEANDERVARGEVEHPLVVFQPRAGFYDHRTRDGLWHWQGAVILGQHRTIEQFVVAGWPRHALGASWVIEMSVSVDHGETFRSSCRLRGRGPEGGAPASQGHS